MVRTGRLFSSQGIVATLLVAFLAAWDLSRVVGQEEPVSLDQVRAQGREASRFLTQQDRPGQTSEQIPVANTAGFQETIAPVLTKSCLACHGPDKSEGRLRIDQLNPDLLTGPDVDRWREVFNALSKSEMPPEGEADFALSDADRAHIVDWLSAELTTASRVLRGRQEQSSFRRLTKYEYNYAIQDLLGLTDSLAGPLPPESVSEDGFRNSSELLQMTGMQFEHYRQIGLKALKRATVVGERPQPVTYRLLMSEELEKLAAKKVVGDPVANTDVPRKPGREQQLFDRRTGDHVPFPGGKVMPQSETAEGPTPAVSPVVLVLPRSGELKLDLDRFLPDDGVMRVRIRAGRSTMNPDEHAGLRLVFSAHTSNDASFWQVVSQKDLMVTNAASDPQNLDFVICLSDIQRNPFRKLATTFPRRDEFVHIQNVSNAAGDDPLQVFIDFIEISAPYYEQWPPQTHTRIFFDSPNRADEQAYGRDVLNRFLRRAWCRPVSAEDVDPYMRLFAVYRPGFSTFEEAMVEVLATALASPEFLYLTQRRADDSPASEGTINDLELAGRLAAFLWCSIPDDELLTLAEQGALADDAVLDAQIDRMLSDPKASRFSRNFVEQWLGLDRMNSVTHVTDATLRDAMLEEPVAFFEEILKHNHSVMDFIHSDYAMLNERLASHYQIVGVYGPHFRRVPVTVGSHRGGLLTSAVIMTMNSSGADSHPLKRGVWMLKRVLDDPPPPPPPNVPEVDLTNPEILKMTVKERIVNHRSKPACYSCHSRIDPWGIAFENYDALGVYRTEINGKPVDASAELFSRQVLNGADGLKRYVLAERQDQFARAVVHKLATFALGRPMTFGDRAAIDSLTSQFRQQNDGLKDLIRLIVKSEMFRSG